MLIGFGDILALWDNITWDSDLTVVERIRLKQKLAKELNNIPFTITAPQLDNVVKKYLLKNRDTVKPDK